MHKATTSRIEAAARGVDNRIESFLREEGFVWTSANRYLSYELTDSQRRHIEVQVRPASIIAVVYFAEGSGIVQHQDTQTYYNYQGFQEAYDKTLDFIRELQS